MITILCTRSTIFFHTSFYKSCCFSQPFCLIATSNRISGRKFILENFPTTHVLLTKTLNVYFHFQWYLRFLRGLYHGVSYHLSASLAVTYLVSLSYCYHVWLPDGLSATFHCRVFPLYHLCSVSRPVMDSWYLKDVFKVETCVVTGN